MPRSRPRPTLGGRIEHRRKQRGLSVSAAARGAGVNRKTWHAWERDTTIPDGRNHRIIEAFCEWEPGSVEAVLDGRAPVRRNLASVTELHPGDVHAPPDDDLVQELRAMRLPEEFIDGLLEAYRSEKADDDTRRQQRYRDLARKRVAG